MLLDLHFVNKKNEKSKIDGRNTCKAVIRAQNIETPPWGHIVKWFGIVTKRVHAQQYLVYIKRIFTSV